MPKKKRKPRAKKKIYKKLCGYCIHYKCEGDIEFNTEACDNFEMVKIFYCNSNGQRIYVEVCIARREGKRCRKNCVQGKLIIEINKLDEDGE